MSTCQKCDDMRESALSWTGVILLGIFIGWIAVRYLSAHGWR